MDVNAATIVPYILLFIMGLPTLIAYFGTRSRGQRKKLKLLQADLDVLFEYIVAARKSLYRHNADVHGVDGRDIGIPPFPEPMTRDDLEESPPIPSLQQIQQSLGGNSNDN